MGKAERHASIREVVQHNRVASQEQLRELLVGRGFDVTQATLSRDIRELRLVKMPDSDGDTHYMLPPDFSDQRPAIARLLPTLYIGAEGTGNLIIVRTLAGGAQAVAEALDWEEWPEVMGTLGGDDSILVVLRDPKHLNTVLQRLDALAQLE